MLESLYQIYADWVAGLPFVCRQGCAACCTQSVTMTSGEGAVMVAFLEKIGQRTAAEAALAGVHLPAVSAAGRPAMTTNQFAASCLAREELPWAEPAAWNFAPCIFLAHDSCSIYPARPFGCRSFGSFVPCEQAGTAELPGMLLTVNTVMLQVIEHLYSNGGWWGNMNDILRQQLGQEKATGADLRPAVPVPGFLLEPAEKQTILALLDRVRQAGLADLTGFV